MKNKEWGEKKKQLSSGRCKTCERFIIIKGRKFRFTKRQKVWPGVALPGMSTIAGATLRLHRKLPNISQEQNTTRLANWARGRRSWGRGRVVIWKWSTYPMWYELTNDPGKFFRMPWRVTYKRPGRVPAETKEKRAMYYKRQKGGKPLKE